jgi:hypothetical protein
LKRQDAVQDAPVDCDIDLAGELVSASVSPLSKYRIVPAWKGPGRDMRRRDFIKLLGCATASLPFAAHAQQAARSYKIGYLALLPDEDATLVKPFLQRPEDLGYSAGKNLTLDYRSADGRPDRLACHCASVSMPSANTGMPRSYHPMPRN